MRTSCSACCRSAPRAPGACVRRHCRPNWTAFSLRRRANRTKSGFGCRLPPGRCGRGPACILRSPPQRCRPRRLPNSCELARPAPRPCSRACCKADTSPRCCVNGCAHCTAMAGGSPPASCRTCSRSEPGMPSCAPTWCKCWANAASGCRASSRTGDGRHRPWARSSACCSGKPAPRISGTRPCCDGVPWIPARPGKR